MQDAPHSDFREVGPYIDHLSHAKPGIRVYPDKLYVITVITNPRRFRARYELWREFENYVNASGAKLLTVEGAFGGRHHEITDDDDPWHLKLRTSTEAWHKENLINIGFAHLTKLVPDWKKVAWIDADVKFERPDWAQETLHLLDHYKFLHMFSHCMDLNDQYEAIPSSAGMVNVPGMIYQYQQFINRWAVEYGMTEEEICAAFFGEQSGGYCYSADASVDGSAKQNILPGHCGYAWAATRKALDEVGGLLDFSICGAGDHHMAAALIGDIKMSINKLVHPNFMHALDTWGQKAERHIKPFVSYMPGLLTHRWHGSKHRRRYRSRWKILIDSQFDPYVDIKRDVQGMWQLTGTKRKLITDLQIYFSQRSEDHPFVQNGAE